MNARPSTHLELNDAFIGWLAQTRTVAAVQRRAARSPDRGAFAERAAAALFTDPFYTTTFDHRRSVLEWALDAGATFERACVLVSEQAPGFMTLRPLPPVAVSLVENPWATCAFDRWLSEHGKNSERSFWDRVLLAAADAGNAEAIGRMLHARPRRSLPSGSKGSVLHHWSAAVRHAHAADALKEFQQLIRKMPHPDRCNDRGQTALHLLLSPAESFIPGLDALSAGVVPFVRALEDAGCSPYAKDHDGIAPCDHARTTLPLLCPEWDARTLAADLPASRAGRVIRF